MELIEAQKLALELIKTGAKHRDYTTVTELATKLKILTTGKGMVGLLRRFVSREDIEEFAQRIALTISITPALAASVKNPFYKVVRNDRIKKSLSIGGNDTKEKQVNEMIARFYGAQNRHKSRGLDYWLKTRFLNLSFTDPNAWIAIEWSAPSSASETIYPMPFEISSKEAVNFKIVNDETKWLFVKQDITFIEKLGDKLAEKSGVRYTLYETDFTIVYEQIDVEYMKSYALKKNEAYYTDEDSKIAYLTKFFEPKVGFPPVLRVGYIPDESTNDRTFVNAFNSGMCYFDKSIKTVSELDLTMTLHAFPQKIQYGNKCPGESRTKKCDGGFIVSDGSECGKCKGTGFIIHKSSQDAIYMKMPEDKKEALDLNNVLVYKSPPIDLIKFQNDYVQQLKGEIHQAVFNSQALVQKNTGGGTAPDGTKTATEIDTNMQGYYDAIEPYTEKQSEVYKDIVTIFGILTGANMQDIEIEHTFPSDYKLKTTDVLLTELKAANESGAPSFLKEAINNDLADINFAGNKMGKVKYYVMQKYYPFKGKTEDQINMLLSSTFVSTRDKVLYANFDAIFQQLEVEIPGFFIMSNSKLQADKLEEKITQYIEKINEETATASADLFRNILTPPTPAEGGNNGSGGSPGKEDDAVN